MPIFGSSPDIEKMKARGDEKSLEKALGNKDFKIRWFAVLALRAIHDPRQYE
jgi:hypothetical protein